MEYKWYIYFLFHHRFFLLDLVQQPKPYLEPVKLINYETMPKVLKIARNHLFYDVHKDQDG